MIIDLDRQQPAHRAVRLEVIGLASRGIADRVKEALEEALMGRSSSGDPLRHRFRNAVDFGPFDLWWGPLLFDALQARSNGRTEVQVFTRADHDRMVSAIAARNMDRRVSR